ncbi:hypothetical protein cce_0218 [Crocosphaera subtropica ATCC 51142]|uniref:Transposase n=1 Tax=Crocosphaera subtropica (strain ATCC 51142 / BH68) TaxID=43989 RepID=B1X068_CROS5|nr:hypothetical protein cce_0218 [Crocosphaera subtropica ATCC 51142]
MNIILGKCSQYWTTITVVLSLNLVVDIRIQPLEKA